MTSLYSSSVTAVTASQVGSYFVQQYYQVLQQQPDYVHQFYNDLSTMVRVDGDSTQTASAVYQIHTLIQSYQFSAIEIKTINSLESWRDGLVVVVSGSVRSKLFSGWRKFVQTFCLAPQEKGYFVINDIFHFVSEEANNYLPPLASGHKDDFQPINSTSQQPLAAEDTLEAQLRENLNSLHLEHNNDYYTSEEQQYQQQYQQHQQQQYQQQQQQHQEDDDDSEGEYEEEPPVEDPSYNHVDYVQEPLHQNTVEYHQEPLHHEAPEYVQEPVQALEEPAPEPVKFTYASILQLKGKSAPPAPSQKPAVKSVLPPPDWHQTPASVASYVPETTSYAMEETLGSEEGESKSVYVRNLPTTVTSQEIFQEFKNFGRITHDGVFLKNRKDVGICFAFVEFEDIEGVQKAIEASPIQLAGRQVYIEGRRAGSGPSSRGGRGRGGARGRGSYNDSSRGGRFGGVSNGRGNGYRNY